MEVWDEDGGEDAAPNHLCRRRQHHPDGETNLHGTIGFDQGSYTESGMDLQI
jgi:hypothetical protein